MTGWLPRRVLPVLMFHRIDRTGDGDPALTVSPETFETHLTWITQRGFRALSLDEAYEAFVSGRVPRRSVLLTFDDGFADTLRIAAPMLAAAGLRAAVFVPAGLLGQEARLAPSYGGASEHGPATGRIADAAELCAWLDSGHDLGSHSLSHSDLTRIPETEIEREAVESKRVLEEAVGRPVTDFCYPYAHHSPEARETVRAAGYRSAYAGEPPTQSLWALPRMMVFPNDSERRFARKLSGHYYWMSAWHRRFL